MKRIRFTDDALYENEGYQRGTTYKSGSTHDFEDHFADRWLRRNLAVEVNTREPLPADDAETIDPLDHDGNGEKGGAKPETGEPATSEEIAAAIDKLDEDDDAHWTAAGLPAVEAVASLAGKPVTRAAINEAAPEAKRPA